MPATITCSLVYLGLVPHLFLQRNFFYVNVVVLKSETILKNLCGDLVEYVAGNAHEA